MFQHYALSSYALTCALLIFEFCLRGLAKLSLLAGSSDWLKITLAKGRWESGRAHAPNSRSESLKSHTEELDLSCITYPVPPLSRREAAAPMAPPPGTPGGAKSGPARPPARLAAAAALLLGRAQASAGARLTGEFGQEVVGCSCRGHWVRQGHCGYHLGAPWTWLAYGRGADTTWCRTQHGCGLWSPLGSWAPCDARGAERRMAGDGELYTSKEFRDYYEYIVLYYIILYYTILDLSLSLSLSIHIHIYIYIYVYYVYVHVQGVPRLLRPRRGQAAVAGGRASLSLSLSTHMYIYIYIYIYIYCAPIYLSIYLSIFRCLLS